MQQTWIERGFFKFGNDYGPISPAQAIRDRLCEHLRLPAKALSIATFPTGPANKHTFWWREGTDNYAEAQFMMKIAKEYPLLSIGISVEKGLETQEDDSDRVMDRALWDWPRLPQHADRLLTNHIPELSNELGRPIQFRVRPHESGATDRRLASTFTFTDGNWYRRHEGQKSVQDMRTYLGELDSMKEAWVDAYFTVDVADLRATPMSPSDVAEVLIRFAPIREILRRG